MNEMNTMNKNPENDDLMMEHNDITSLPNADGEEDSDSFESLVSGMLIKPLSSFDEKYKAWR